MKSVLITVVLGVLLFEFGSCELQQLTVKVLAQRRVESLNRLLLSLNVASYPKAVNIDIEIHVDQLFSSGGWFWTRRATIEERKQRQEVLDAADAFVADWKHGNAQVVQTDKWRGVRDMWLTCSNPGIFGEEFTRVLILEDDVELSPAWYVLP